MFAPGTATPNATLMGVSSSALAFDASGNLYVANYTGNGHIGSVNIYTPGATTPRASLSGVNGPGALIFDGGGNLYVANTNNGSYSVSRFSPVNLNLIYTVVDGNGGSNYSVTQLVGKSGAINKASLTIMAIPSTKNYDRSTTAAAKPIGAGLVGADTVTGQREVYSDRNAGASKTLSVSAYTVNDSNNGNNYTVTTVASTTGLINKAALTIQAATNTKIYDSTTTVGATPFVSGLFGTDSASGLVERYADQNVGTGKTVSVSGYTINDGDGGNNYTVTTISNTTGVINKATLVITAITNTKTYDSTTSTFAAPIVSGLKGNDAVVNLAEVFTASNTGLGKTLSISAYTINDGNNGNNYTVTTVNNTTGVISKAPLTIAALADTKIYDATTASAAVPNVTGLVGSDTVTGLAEVYAGPGVGFEQDA